MDPPREWGGDRKDNGVFTPSSSSVNPPEGGGFRPARYSYGINRLLGHLNHGRGLVAGGVFGDGADGVRARRDFLDVPVAAQRSAGAGTERFAIHCGGDLGHGDVIGSAGLDAHVHASDLRAVARAGDRDGRGDGVGDFEFGGIFHGH